MPMNYDRKVKNRYSIKDEGMRSGKMPRNYSDKKDAAVTSKGRPKTDKEQF